MNDPLMSRLIVGFSILAGLLFLTEAFTQEKENLTAANNQAEYDARFQTWYELSFSSDPATAKTAIGELGDLLKITDEQYPAAKTLRARALQRLLELCQLGRTENNEAYQAVDAIYAARVEIGATLAEHLSRHAADFIPFGRLDVRHPCFFSKRPPRPFELTDEIVVSGLLKTISGGLVKEDKFAVSDEIFNDVAKLMVAGSRIEDPSAYIRRAAAAGVVNLTTAKKLKDPSTLAAYLTKRVRDADLAVAYLNVLSAQTAISEEERAKLAIAYVRITIDYHDQPTVLATVVTAQTKLQQLPKPTATPTPTASASGTPPAAPSATPGASPSATKATGGAGSGSGSNNVNPVANPFSVARQVESANRLGVAMSGIGASYGPTPRRDEAMTRTRIVDQNQKPGLREIREKIDYPAKKAKQSGAAGATGVSVGAPTPVPKPTR